MDIKAEQKYIRMTPRKLRLVANAVKKLPVDEALVYLKFINKRAAQPILKVFEQAVANAKNNHQLTEDSLKIKSLEIEKGSIYKRWQPVSRGRAHSILKRTSHIRLVLESEKVTTKNIKKAQPKKLTTQQAVAQAKKANLRTKPDLNKTEDKTQSTQKGAKSAHQPSKAGQTKIISSEGK